MTTQTVFPDITHVHVFLTWEQFDRADEDAPEMDPDWDKAGLAFDAIEDECTAVFPNASFSCLFDGEQYGTQHTNVVSNLGEYPSAAYYTLTEIIDQFTIYA